MRKPLWYIHAVYKHGHKRIHVVSTEYRTWQNMLTRCENPRVAHFARYGGIGITVCARWHDFQLFLADMGLKPISRYSIDRIDSTLGYFPDNCRWASTFDQARNKRSNIWTVVDGQRMCLTDACRHLGLNRGTVKSRIHRSGWTINKALGLPEP